MTCCRHHDNVRSLIWPKFHAHVAEGRLWLADVTKKTGDLILYDLEWRAVDSGALLDKLDYQSVADCAVIWGGWTVGSAFYHGQSDYEDGMKELFWRVEKSRKRISQHCPNLGPWPTLSTTPPVW